LDEDIQSLANPQPQDIPTEDNQDNQDTLDNSIDPTNTLDFLQYSGQI